MCSLQVILLSGSSCHSIDRMGKNDVEKGGGEGGDPITKSPFYGYINYAYFAIVRNIVRNSSAVSSSLKNSKFIGSGESHQFQNLKQKPTNPQPTWIQIELHHWIIRKMLHFVQSSWAFILQWNSINRLDWQSARLGWYRYYHFIIIGINLAWHETQKQMHIFFIQVHSATVFRCCREFCHSIDGSRNIYACFT